MVAEICQKVGLPISTVNGLVGILVVVVVVVELLMMVVMQILAADVSEVCSPSDGRNQMSYSRILLPIRIVWVGSKES